MSGTRDLADGESAFVQGSAAKPYEIKNTGGVYSCSCPAWRNQSMAIDRRSCKHIRGLRGEAAEASRVGSAGTVSRKRATATTAAPVLLAQKWEPDVDLTGWWLSEKLDGVRAYWSGTEMFSRLGNRFEVPDWFTEVLGEQPLDGELWVGRGEFQKTVGIVRRADKSDLWREVKFLIFDCPGNPAAFEERIQWLHSTFADARDHIEIVDHIECAGSEHLAEELARVEGLGGEGLMARKPGSKYVPARSSTLLKIKTFLEDDAIVVGHTAGAGRHKGRLGALEAELRSGVSFNVGTGLSDAQREDPPPIGSIVNVRFQELTRDGVPRFPSFVGVRVDVEWEYSAKANKARVNKKRAKATKKKAAAAVSTLAQPVPPDVSTSGDRGARMFELKDDSSQKFWEIVVSGSSYVVRYGRIGSAGTGKEKSFDSPQAASAAAAKIVGAKMRKGYVEIV